MDPINLLMNRYHTISIANTEVEAKFEASEFKCMFKCGWKHGDIVYITWNRNLKNTDFKITS